MTAGRHDISSEKISGFEDLYLGLRGHEQRIYSDEEVRKLPEISKEHPHSSEWKIRAASCSQLLQYLTAKERSLKILEVGCGNGWLSHQLSKLRHSNVVGLDINEYELKQAERVFKDLPNLYFFHAGLDSSLLEYESFDIVIFAASIQYFPSLTEAIETALDRLKANGEVHIIDTHFYHQQHIKDARERSRLYFQSNGFERMNEFYFHHSMEELENFKPEKFTRVPGWNKLLNKKHPFPWICIRK